MINLKYIKQIDSILRKERSGIKILNFKWLWFFSYIRLVLCRIYF